MGVYCEEHWLNLCHYRVDVLCEGHHPLLNQYLRVNSSVAVRLASLLLF
jgi:hypothetical protein